MKNIDISRDSFDPKKNFSRVLKQQGRVELDADWNEQVSITLRYLRTMMSDLIGPHGGPVQDCGFRVLVQGDDVPSTPGEARKLLNDCKAGDFVLSKGRYYIDGLLCENHSPLLYTHQPRRSVLKPAPKKCYLVYLDAWESEVTSLDDDRIREVALGGADTAARMQVVWRVRTVAIEKAETGKPRKNSTPSDLSPTWAEHVEAFQSAHRGALAARARQLQDDPNIDVSGTEGSYCGLENQLYRVEVHRSGKSADTPADTRGPTFKWSRDNGTAAFPVVQYAYDDDRHIHVTLAAAGRDDTVTLTVGDAVEFNDVPVPRHDLARVMFQVVDVDLANLELTLLRPVPLASKPASVEVRSDAAHALVLRRWDYGPGLGRKGGLKSSEGALLIQEGQWLPLEDGIQIWFEPPRSNAVHQYRAGDYWLVKASVIAGDVEWESREGNPQPLPPHGVEHHYAPLALIDVTPNETQVIAFLSRSFGYLIFSGLGPDAFVRDKGEQA